MKTQTPMDTKASCETGKGSCGCGQGVCPGMILGGVLLAGFGLYELVSWMWGLMAG